MHLNSYAICDDVGDLPLAMFIQRLTYETQGRDFLLQEFKDDQQNKHFKDRLGSISFQTTTYHTQNHTLRLKCKTIPSCWHWSQCMFLLPSVTGSGHLVSMLDQAS